jgi:DNA-directed RNA polymerase specialized sigma24 family protein
MALHTEPLRLAARLALARSLAPRIESANRAHPDAGQIARVNAAIRQLPEPQREVFLAVRLHDRSLGEIAHELAMPLAETERAFAAALIAIMHALETR